MFDMLLDRNMKMYAELLKDNDLFKAIAIPTRANRMSLECHAYSLPS